MQYPLGSLRQQRGWGDVRGRGQRGGWGEDREVERVRIKDRGGGGEDRGQRGGEG